MLEKLNEYTKHPSLKVLSDTRALGLIAFGIIAILVTWSSVRTIQTNYELQKQIASLEQENMIKKLENENQKLRNEYFKTDQFLELAARRQFGKAAPGEQLYVVPKKVALANSIELKSDNQQTAQKESDKPDYQKNLEAWLDFFIFRSNQ
jgi:cell division protein FtsB